MLSKAFLTGVIGLDHVQSTSNYQMLAVVFGQLIACAVIERTLLQYRIVPHVYKQPHHALACTVGIKLCAVIVFLDGKALLWFSKGRHILLSADVPYSFSVASERKSPRASPTLRRGRRVYPGHLRGKCDKADDRHEVIFKAYRGKSLADYPCSHRAEGCFIKAL